MNVETETKTMGEESPEDLEAKELMKAWGVDGEVDVPDEPKNDNDIDDPEELLEKYRRHIDISPDNAIDQILLGTCDLEKAILDFEQMTGTKPVLETSIRGTGTKSARVAFESCAYLEIVGPDPKQPETALSKALAGLEAGKLEPLHYGVRQKKASELNVRQEWQKAGLDYDEITMVAKDQGKPWLWDLYFFKQEDGICPFFTNWRNDLHVCAKHPIVGELGTVKVSAPADHVIHTLLDGPYGIEMEKGPKSLEFSFTSSKGTHTFSTSTPLGISFPDEGGLPVKKMY